MKYIEYEFTARDLDSDDMLIDTVLIRDSSAGKNIFDILTKYIATGHELTTLSGNTWEIEDFIETGLQTDRVDGKHVKISPRDSEFSDKEYPIVNED